MNYWKMTHCQRQGNHNVSVTVNQATSNQDSSKCIFDTDSRYKIEAKPISGMDAWFFILHSSSWIHD